MSIYDHLEFRHLKYFVAIADERSFTKASQRVHGVQSNLSKQIHELEELYGAQLFTRGAKGGVSLTPAGQSFYNFARQLLELREEAVNSLQAVQQTASHPFRLGFSQYVEHLVIQTVSQAYKELFPRGEIHAEGNETDELLRQVKAGQLEAALVTLPLGIGDLCAQPVMHERMVILLCKDDPLAANAELKPSDLTKRLAIFSDPRHHPSAHERLLELLNEQGIEPKIMAANFTMEHIQWMVCERMFMALIRENEVIREGLTTRPIHGVSWTIDSAIVYRQQDRPGALSLLLRDIARRFPVADAKPPRKKPHLSKTDILPFEVTTKKAIGA